MRKILFLFLGYLVLLVPAMAEIPIKNMKIFEDKFGIISADQALQVHVQGKYNPVKSQTINYGFTKSALWLYCEFDISTAQAGDYIGYFSYPHLDEIQIYDPGNTSKPAQVLGDSFPFNKRLLKTRHLHFKHEIKTGKSALLMRVRSAGPISFRLAFLTASEFQNADHEEQIILGIFYGILLVMIAYNAFVFISLRSLAYFYYLSSIAAFLLFQLALDGTGFMYFWGNSVWWQNKAVSFLAGLFTLLGVSFTISFLRTSQVSVLAHRILLAVGSMAALVCALSLFVPYHLSVRAVTLVGALFAFSAIFAGSIGLLRNFRPARYFMLAWTFFLIGGLLYQFKSFGLLPEMFITNNGIKIGSAFEVILLSIALADRINTLRQEKEQSEKDALERRARMLDSFRRFVPEQFIVKLGRENIEQVQEGDSSEAEVSLMFHDIRNFTRLSETMTAHENFRFINSYLSKVSPVIEKHNGFIDKFLGDAIMAIFPKGEGNALNAAIDMRLALLEYNKRRYNFSYPAIETGAGIHAGNVMMGTVGSLNRLDTTVIGDVVNTTSRLESITKQYKAGILASGEAVALSGIPSNASSRPLDRILLRGKSKPIEVFEVFLPEESPINEKKQKNVQLFSDAVRHFRDGNFSIALKLFQQVSLENPDDAGAVLFAERCMRLASRKFVPGVWTGIIKMK